MSHGRGGGGGGGWSMGASMGPYYSMRCRRDGRTICLVCRSSRCCSLGGAPAGAQPPNSFTLEGRLALPPNLCGPTTLLEANAELSAHSRAGDDSGNVVFEWSNGETFGLARGVGRGRGERLGVEDSGWVWGWQQYVTERAPYITTLAPVGAGSRGDGRRRRSHRPAGLAGLPGAAGSQGATGPSGPQGSQGLQGSAARGLAGRNRPDRPAGLAGRPGLQGAAGSQGATGPTGRAGLAGPPGRQGSAAPQARRVPTKPL
jgi:hypothetical protein